MAALAELSIAMGARVFGCDAAKSERTKRLSSLGALIAYSHGKSEIYRIVPDLVIYSLAVGENSPELRAAATLGIPTVSRAEYMGAVMKDYGLRIGICGSHGKSTVTAMLDKIFCDAEKNPTVLCGAVLASGASCRIGSRDFLIYEACEYGDSFLSFSPGIAIALNLEMDHTDYFSAIDDLKSSFSRALSLASDAAIVNVDDENLRSIIPSVKSRVITYGRSDGADYRIDNVTQINGRFSFELYEGSKRIASPTLAVPGEFNVYNAAAAIVAARHAGLDIDLAISAVDGYSGIGRRIEYLGRRFGCDIYYDYAHHPTEIAATQKTLAFMGYKNICALFSPHTYSRTKYFFDSFADRLSAFSKSLITEIYPAREAPIIGLSASLLAEAVRERGTESYAVGIDFDISKELSGFDCVVLMGAGDLEKIKEKIMKNEV